MSAAIERLRRMLARPGAWIDRVGASADAASSFYAIRLGGDRRTRVSATLDEAAFRALVQQPGLVVRKAGGWSARPVPGTDSAPPPGRPGMEAGERLMMAGDGTMVCHAANLGESPVAWLARRRDAEGRPYLSPAEAAAGERLRIEAETALKGPSVTMRWDALPRSGGGSSARVEPSDRALSAAARVEAALTACGPRHRPIVQAVCIDGASLTLAERGLGLQRRAGKLWLKTGLQRLARHYRIG